MTQPLLESLNEVLLQGVITESPEIRYIAYEYPSARLTLMTTEMLPIRSGESTYERRQWHRLVAYGAIAQEIERSALSGCWVRVRGRIAYHKVVDREGSSYTITEIGVHELEILERPAPCQQSTSPAAPRPEEIDWDSYAPSSGEDPFA